jgi:magnesium-transporting ATPase (P-type)
LEDPLRSDIKDSIQLIKYGHLESPGERENHQVNIRMVTGDHIDTANAVALKLGLLKVEHLHLGGFSMTGEQFREAIGKYQLDNSNPEDIKIMFEEPRKFESIRSTLRVLARCTAEDKQILVSAFKLNNGFVGMTGDSIADAKALRNANVGLCMGSGCDVAKDNSDLVILDNDFVSIHRAIKWGRAIFDNVRKFLQH